MIIRDVILSTGQSSFVNRDRLAIRRGAKPNGYLYDGEPALAGFDTIVQAGEIVSVILVLEDGSLAFGDCVDVISAGYAGRDRRFRAADHLPTLRSRLVPGLIGQPLDSFRVLAAEVDAMAVEGERLHTAVRYGVTQALLHAVALSRREQVAETLAREYGLLIGRDRLPILSLCARNNTDLHDRMILKRADILPHASFGEIDQHVGRDGQLFLDYVRYFRDRVKEVGADDYAPRLHFDMYGSIGAIFGDDPDQVADYLGRVAETAAPFDLLIESPFVTRGIEPQIEIFGRLRDRLAAKGIPCTIIADEWCNTLEDIRAWCAAGTTDMVQIKTPDLGGLDCTIDAAMACREAGMRFYLGGTANETHQSALIATHVALATRPEFTQAKPGLGGDESYALVLNEMTRTIDVLDRLGSPWMQ